MYFGKAQCSQCHIVDGKGGFIAQDLNAYGKSHSSEAIIKAMGNMQSQSTSNPSSISQAAAEAALNGSQDYVHMMCKAFRERHDYVHMALTAMPGVKMLPADGTFYAFPD